MLGGPGSGAVTALGASPHLHGVEREVDVYCLHNPVLKIAKIGVASDIARRMRQLAPVHGQLELVHRWAFLTSAEAFQLEKAAHWWFGRHHIEPRDWVQLGMRADSGSEWFWDAILDTAPSLDTAAVLRAYKGTRVYEVRVSKAHMEALRARKMTVADAIEAALA